MPTFVHMHEGETVYYGDGYHSTCYVCDADEKFSADNIKAVANGFKEAIEETMTENHNRLCGCSYQPGTVDELEEYLSDADMEAAPKPAYREPFRIPWYAIQHFFLSVLFLALVVGAWELVIILADILQNGRVSL